MALLAGAGSPEVEKDKSVPKSTTNRVSPATPVSVSLLQDMANSPLKARIG